MDEEFDLYLISGLRKICGVVSVGTNESIHIYQDIGSLWWVLEVGEDTRSSKKRKYTANSFNGVIEIAIDKELPHD